MRKGCDRDRHRRSPGARHWPAPPDNREEEPQPRRFLVLRTDCREEEAPPSPAADGRGTAVDDAPAAAGAGGSNSNGSSADFTSASSDLSPSPSTSTSGWHAAWREFLAAAPLTCDVVLVADAASPPADTWDHGSRAFRNAAGDGRVGGGGGDNLPPHRRRYRELFGPDGAAAVVAWPHVSLRGCGRSNVLSVDLEFDNTGRARNYQGLVSSCHLSHDATRLPLAVRSPSWSWDASDPTPSDAVVAVVLDATEAREQFRSQWERSHPSPAAPEQLGGPLLHPAPAESSLPSTPWTTARDDDNPASLRLLRTVHASLERELLYTHRALATVGTLLVGLLVALLWDVFVAPSPQPGRRRKTAGPTSTTTVAAAVPPSSSQPPARHLPPTTVICRRPVGGGGIHAVSPLSLDPSLGGLGVPSTGTAAWSPCRKLKEEWDLRLQARRRDHGNDDDKTKEASNATGPAPTAPVLPAGGTLPHRDPHHPRPSRRIIRRAPLPPPQMPEYRTPPRPAAATAPAAAAAVVTPLPYEAGSAFLDEFWGD